jgi:OHCU decarboxylase
MIDLEALNRSSPVAFVEALGAIFEHSPWVAERAASLRPFGSRLHLLDSMRNVVQGAKAEEQLGLICAHPQLGARGRRFARLTAESAREQRGAGLDACNDEEFALLLRLNLQYVEKFAFPFILAVRGHDPESIIDTLKRRLTHDGAREQATALTEIGLIAGYRLSDTVATPVGVEIAAMLERLRPSAERALLREWMLASGLQMDGGADEGLLTASRDASPDRIVIHFDARARALRCDGQLAMLMGIGVAQQLRQQGIRAPFDRLVAAHPTDPATADLSSLAHRAEAHRAEVYRAQVHRAAEASDVPALERAACALEEFLLQAERHVAHPVMTHD